MITLWLPESSSVAHAKQCIVESGRSTIATTHNGSFRLVSGRGLEMKNDDKVERYALPGDPQRVYACLKLRKTVVDISNSFEAIFPPANTTISALPSAITVQFAATTDTSQHYEIYVRTDRSEIVEGTMSCEGKSLLFTPVQCLQYNRSYVVHVDSERGDVEWVFTIAPLPSLRMLVKCLHRCSTVSHDNNGHSHHDHHEHDVPDRSSLINLSRQSPALYAELLQLIVKRFKVQEHTIWKIVATKSDGLTHAVTDDRDVGELNDFYSLAVSVDINIPSPPDPPAGTTQPLKSTQLNSAQFNSIQLNSTQTQINTHHLPYLPHNLPHNNTQGNPCKYDPITRPWA